MSTVPAVPAGAAGAGGAGGAGGTADFARAVAPLVDRAFRAGMAGRDVLLRHGGGPAVGLLVEFRPSLAAPGRVITGPQWRAVLRYRDHAEGARAIAGCVAAGTLAAAGSGSPGGPGSPAGDGFRATDAGLAFLHELTAHLDRVLTGYWGGSAAPLVGPLSTVHGAVRPLPDGAFAALTPAHEPPGAGAGLRLLNLLSGLRYFRADAHAAAWSAAGLTAAGVQALPPGPGRDAIEAATDRLAAPPWAGVASGELLDLLAALRHEG